MNPHDDAAGGVWAVVYGNYYPGEVLALYDNQAAAERHVADSDDPLEVRPMTVHEDYRP